MFGVLLHCYGVYCCSGVMRTGLNAIMGPSGSGKTRFTLCVNNVAYKCSCVYL